MTHPDPIRNEDAQPHSPSVVPSRDAITGGFSKNADLLSYLISGLLIGLLLDWIFGTSPILLVLWTLAGMGLGFYRLWQGSAALDDEGKARTHGV
ncbi:MAG: hypothetical protein GWP18_02435 [Proteobacteria bacterium]|nr:hypothetical protein [Pseudomonadota bacterium]